MKNSKIQLADPDMRSEYDFTGAVRGKYYQRFREGTNVVVLDPDVSLAFPDSASVNKALRALASVARKSVSVIKRHSGRPRSLKKRTERQDPSSHDLGAIAADRS